MTQFVVKIRALFSLGFVNVIRVVFYRLGLKIGVSPLCRLKLPTPSGPFFSATFGSVKIKTTTEWSVNSHYFGWFSVSCNKSFPDWHVNPFTGCRVAKCDSPWWKIPDFDPQVGDIKTVWEASRFDWVLAMAQRIASGDKSELSKLNAWLADWCDKNPAYLGPNWKCGQEASIRVMHLAMAAKLLGQHRNSSKALMQLIRVHLQRIAPSIGYAIQLPEFSTRFYERLSAAANWLYQMTLQKNGDAPNLGANDGAYLLPLAGTDYRDYRPSVQLAGVLFAGKRAYGSAGDWNLPLQWLGIELPGKEKRVPESTWFPQGGYCTLHAGDAFALFNIPCFRFRPSQADALHVDLWLSGENLLRDAGTCSYNASDDITDYFGGTAGHNTVQFDDRDQMPRLSRFLFGEWLKAVQVTPLVKQNGQAACSAAYRDWQGGFHHRTVILSDKKLQVIDKVSGFSNKAVLRWRLQPGQWHITDTSVCSNSHKLRVTSNVCIERFEMRRRAGSRVVTCRKHHYRFLKLK